MISCELQPVGLGQFALTRPGRSGASQPHRDLAVEPGIGEVSARVVRELGFLLRPGQIALEPAGLGPGQSDGADVHLPGRSVRGGHRGIQVWPHIWIAAARRDNGQAGHRDHAIHRRGDGGKDGLGDSHRLVPASEPLQGRRPHAAQAGVVRAEIMVLAIRDAVVEVRVGLGVVPVGAMQLVQVRIREPGFVLDSVLKRDRQRTPQDGLPVATRVPQGLRLRRRRPALHRRLAESDSEFLGAAGRAGRRSPNALGDC